MFYHLVMSVCLIKSEGKGSLYYRAAQIGGICHNVVMNFLLSPLLGKKNICLMNQICYVQPLTLSMLQFEPVLCLLENICAFSEPTESQKAIWSSRNYKQIFFLFPAAKCLINPNKHVLC